MFSSLSNYWVSIGLIASLIVTYLTWVYSRDLAPIFMFIAGAFFTMLTQERRVRERAIKMTEHIYGPLHKELNSILTNLKGFGAPTGSSLKTIMNDFGFNLVKKELGYRIGDFQERLEPYTVLWRAARYETESHLMMRGGMEVRFEVWAGGDQILRFPMMEPIFKDKTPLDFLAEKVGRYQNISMIVYVKNKSEGQFSPEHRIHQTSIDILKKVREDPSVQRQRREREYLMKECNSLLTSLEKEFVL